MGTKSLIRMPGKLYYRGAVEFRILEQIQCCPNHVWYIRTYPLLTQVSLTYAASDTTQLSRSQSEYRGTVPFHLTFRRLCETLSIVA
jgi:hypothetical protein